MKKYYKKSDTFTAIKFDGENIKEVVELLHPTQYFLVTSHHVDGDSYYVQKYGKQVFGISVGQLITRDGFGVFRSLDDSETLQDSWVEIHDEPRGSADV